MRESTKRTSPLSLPRKSRPLPDPSGADPKAARLDQGCAAQPVHLAFLGEEPHRNQHLNQTLELLLGKFINAKSVNQTRKG